MKKNKYYYVKDYIDYTLEEEEELKKDMLNDGVIEQDATEEEINNIMFDLITEYQEEDLNFFLDALNELDCYIILNGYFGRWNGKKQACKIIKYQEEFKNILYGYDGISIYYEDNKIILKLADHDGSSYFELKATTKKGNELINNKEYDYKYFDYEEINNIFNTNFYSTRLINKLKQGD